MAEGNKPYRFDKKKQEKSSSDGELEQRREALEAELTRRGVSIKPKPEEGEHRPNQGMAQAIKLSSEFLAGVVVGIVLGLGFDQLVGTSPWGLIVFLFLGFAAGVLNVLRSVGRVAPSPIGKSDAKGAAHLKHHDNKTDRSN